MSEMNELESAAVRALRGCVADYLVVSAETMDHKRALEMCIDVAGLGRRYLWVNSDANLTSENVGALMYTIGKLMMRGFIKWHSVPGVPRFA